MIQLRCDSERVPEDHIAARINSFGDEHIEVFDSPISPPYSSVELSGRKPPQFLHKLILMISIGISCVLEVPFVAKARLYQPPVAAELAHRIHSLALHRGRDRMLHRCIECYRICYFDACPDSKQGRVRAACVIAPAFCNCSDASVRECGLILGCYAESCTGAGISPWFFILECRRVHLPQIFTEGDCFDGSAVQFRKSFLRP